MTSLKLKKCNIRNNIQIQCEVVGERRHSGQTNIIYMHRTCKLNSVWGCPLVKPSKYKTGVMQYKYQSPKVTSVQTMGKLSLAKLYKKANCLAWPKPNLGGLHQTNNWVSNRYPCCDLINPWAPLATV